MILTGPKIYEEVLSRKIIIEPFFKQFLNTNSYDFRLGNIIKHYRNRILDASIENEIVVEKIPKSGIKLLPDKIYLGHTIEKIGSDFYVPIIRGKSSTGRLGLFIHITADLIDIGFHGNFTLMMHAVQTIRIYPGMRIGQVTFWKVIGDIELYKGKYQGSTGPEQSKCYRDFRG